MYKSPIEILNSFSDSLTQRFVEETDKLVLTAVYNIGVKMDKDELIKALEYDRNQYEQGYEDGKAEALHDFKIWLANEYFTFGRINTIPELLGFLDTQETHKEVWNHVVTYVSDYIQK